VIADTSSDGPPAAHATKRVLVELLQLEREIRELEFVRRSDALERVADAVRGLGEIGPAEGIIATAAAALGASSKFDRVVISEVLERGLRPLAVWQRDDPRGAERALAALRGAPIRLEYPLIEDEVARGHGVELVSVVGAGARTPAALAGEFDWDSYVVAALTARGESIGLLHADATASGRPLNGLDTEVAAKFAEGLSGVFERAVLRHTLQLHRAELQSAVQWMGGRLNRLSEDAGFEGPRPGSGGDPGLVESLTPRELEVMQLLARGHTNLAIAHALVVREGTVKYHVKNILRKLGARSRSDAVARFVRSGGTGATG
jgi:LuxR family transcriptional regulator, regulator of acetate metabolism